MNDEMKSIKKLLFKVGQEVTNEAKDIAPYKTGNLKRDIQVFDWNIDNLEIEVGNTKLASYAPYVHQGTGRQARGRSKAPNKKGQKSQPYLEDAIKKYVSSGYMDRALNNCGDEISEDIFKKFRMSLNNARVK